MKYVIIGLLALLLMFGCTNNTPPKVNDTPVKNDTKNESQMYCVKTCHIDVDTPGTLCQLKNSKDQICTMEYRIGDVCLQTFDCQMSGSNCQVVNNDKFNLCASCVKSCGSDMECAQKCANPKMNNSNTTLPNTNTTTNMTTNTTTNTPTNTTTNGTMMVVSKVELAKHNTSSNCWVSYEGDVYDLTNWLPKHPGSAGAISPYCGMAEEFEKAFVGQHGTTKVPFLDKVGTYKGNYTQ